MSSNRLSDRGFTASRGLSYTFTGTATEFDAALPLSHGLGALPGALELWVEVSAGQWEQHDPATYVTASTTALTTTGTTLASVVGGATNVRLVAAAGAVAVSVEEASLTKAGIVSTGAQSFAGVKTFAVDPTFTSGSQLVTTGAQTVGGAKTFSDNANFGGNLTLNNATPARLNFLDVNHPYIIGDRFGLSTRGGLLFKAYNGGEVDAGQFNHTGAWTLGPSSGLGTSHIAQSGSSEVLQMYRRSSVASSGIGIAFKNDATDSTTDYSAIFGYGGSARTDAFQFWSIGSGAPGAIGSATRAGAWTLGPTTKTAGATVNGTFTVAPSGTTGNFTVASSGLASQILLNNGITTRFGATVVPHVNSTYNLGGASNRWSTIFAVNNLDTSDERLKTNIVTMSPMLKKLIALKPKNFTSKYESYEIGKEGFIAQEYAEIFPEDVVEYEEEIEGLQGVKGIRTTGLAWEARLVKAIQELHAELQAAKAEIELLKNPA